LDRFSKYFRRIVQAICGFFCSQISLAFFTDENPTDSGKSLKMAKQLDDIIKELELARRTRIADRAAELATLRVSNTEVKQTSRELTPVLRELGDQSPT
jgi:hypothetical protein